MTNHELARILLAEPERRVLVDGYEGGLDGPNIRVTTFVKDSDTDMYSGEYIENPSSETAEEATVISRYVPGTEFSSNYQARHFLCP